MSIQILPPEIANQIAAGEVVERPASVVKECIENSIDAGAENIEISIKKAGKELIQITDDGKGMSTEDAKKCHLRHATSKIKKIDDLFSLQSFGFRGEALSAISSVSDFSLETKRQGDEQGTKVEIFAGKNITHSPTPSNTGTVITIKKLFHPLPARLSYLKSDITENRAINKEIESFVLNNPEIVFKFFRDEKLVLNFPKSNKLERTTTILKENPDDLIDVFFKSREISISGFIIKPGKCVTNKKYQYLFVNGRRIEDYKLNYAIREAYVQSSGIENHLNPKFVIFIEIDPILVDVNVHPRKLEIKFSEPGAVFRNLKNSVITSLEKKSTIPFIASPELNKNKKIAGFSTPSQFPIQKSYKGSQNQFSHSFSEKNMERDLQYFDNNSITQDNDSLANPDLEIDELKLIGQIAKKYILAEDKNGVWIFDQHALHERQRFEEFWNSREKLVKDIQKLLIPYSLKIEAKDWEIIWQNRQEIEELGFKFSQSKEVLALPSILKAEDLDKIFAGFSDFFKQEKVGENFVDKFLRKILEYKSCRGAVMFGDKLEPTEMQKLLNDFQTTGWRNLCPHGRPNHVFWRFNDLDRMFHR